MDAIAIMELIKLLGGALGSILTVSAVLTLFVKPIREKFAKWINKTANTQEFENKFTDINSKIDNLTTLVEKSIEQNNELQAEMIKQSEALKASLRNSILKIYYDCKAKGYITTFQLQNVTELFENYKALGGNSFISHIMDEIFTKFPVQD